jgi:hypothetical protein
MVRESGGVWMNVMDDLGLVQEGEHLTVFLPTTSKALVFRVKSRANRHYEVFNYGALPLTSGTSLPTYDAGSTSVPADGVIPARAYTPGLSFPLDNAFDEGDMWYIPQDYRDRLFHVIQRITPAFLRVDVQIPMAVTQGRFQKDKIMTGIEKDFGFARGSCEVIHLPNIHYGYRYGNDTNVPLYTFAKFIYAEYVVETPKNSSLIFDILTRRVPSYWISLPINIMDPVIEGALVETYGITGFPLYGMDERDKAVREYNTLLREVKV